MSNRIPFDLEKWQSGEYDVEYRDGKKPLSVYHIKEALIWNILSVSGCKNSHKHHINGNYYSNNRDCALDLFLTPKKKKGWVVVYGTDNGGFFTHSYTMHDENKLTDFINANINAGFKMLHKIEFEY